MTQQPHTSNLLQEQQIIQKWVVGIVRHTIKTEGLEEARRFFKTIKDKSGYMDLMPPIVRKVEKIFADEEKKLSKEKDNAMKSAITRTINITGANATYTENND